jgi:virginiamycin B lyase
MSVLVLVLLLSCSGPTAKPTSSSRPSPRASAATNLSTGGIVEYPVPDPGTHPTDCYGLCRPSLGSMARGPDGNIWYVDVARSVVGKITPSGQVLQYPVPPPVGGAQTIAAGPDGNVWLTAGGSGSDSTDWIVRVTPDGVVTKFPAGGAHTAPESITAGPDGNLWFTEVFGGKIGRMTPSGLLSEFPFVGSPELRGITIGPDGNLWFTSSYGVGKITTGGESKIYPTGHDPSIVAGDITTGPDGNLWFSDYTGLARVAPATGKVTPMALPEGSHADTLVPAPDGNIWATDNRRNGIMRINVSGNLREFSIPRRNAEPHGMALGADGRLWFGEVNYGLIGRIGLRVPEVSLSHRVFNFAGVPKLTVTVTNTGDGSLSISNVATAGVDSSTFAVVSDGCIGKSLQPGSRCDLVVRSNGAGGTLRSGLLQISDNASGTPQSISLVDGLAACELPVLAMQNGKPQGDLLNVATGDLTSAPGGGFDWTSTEASTARRAASGARTTTPPVLNGMSPGYFDRQAGRWLPVPGPNWVSPDGSRYLYLDYSYFDGPQVHVVDVATGRDRVLQLPSGFWGLISFGRDGIYLHQAYEGPGPGLTVVDPDTGVTRTLLSTGTVESVTESDAWMVSRDPADTLPPPGGIGQANNTLSSRNLATGAITTWLYRPGKDVGVMAVVNGVVFASERTDFETTIEVVTAPNQASTLHLPFTFDAYPIVSQVIGDSPGVWLGTADGLYLWTARTNGVLVSDAAVTPAGMCG